MSMLPLLLAAATAAASAPAGGPIAPGRYDAQMCVALNAQPPTCGPLEGRVDAEGTLELRVDDIRYLLFFEQGLMIGITMHGGMQIAEFLSSYRWTGDTLLFGDRPRHAQFEVRLRPAGAPR